MYVMLSSVKSSLKKKPILHKVALGMRVYTANPGTNTIECILYKYMYFIYMVIPCNIFLSDRPSNGFVTYICLIIGMFI